MLKYIKNSIKKFIKKHELNNFNIITEGISQDKINKNKSFLRKHSEIKDEKIFKIVELIEQMNTDKPFILLTSFIEHLSTDIITYYEEYCKNDSDERCKQLFNIIQEYDLEKFKQCSICENVVEQLKNFDI